jgi:hypothetical protein
VAAVAALTLLGVMAAPSRAVLLGPTPYLSSADIPFAPGAFTSFFLENFEDGLLNTPGVTATAGWFASTPSPLTDSVDGDDGTIDGFGTAGRSFYSGGNNRTLTFTFDAAALGGALPTYAGIAWTDVGSVTSGTYGFGGVTFSAIDSAGNSLGAIGPVTLGDGLVAGQTAEDRLFAVASLAGIRSITISMDNSTDWEVDHLQYGAIRPAAIPEPSSVALLGLGAAGLLVAARRRRRHAGC